MSRAFVIVALAVLVAWPAGSAMGGGLAKADSVRSRLPTTTLHLGSRGPAVRALQERLIELRYLPWRSADGVYGMRTWHAVVAFQGWQRLARTGVAGRHTRAVLVTARTPRPWGGLRRGLELDLARQVLLVIAHGKTSRAIHVSTAAPGYRTPTGRFRVYHRALWSWSVPFQVWMQYALYFSGGYAIHGFSSVPAYPASHGCVRVPLYDAPALYAETPVGTPVLAR